MYSEIIKDLKHCAIEGDCQNCTYDKEEDKCIVALLLKAAITIEEMQKRLRL